MIDYAKLIGKRLKQDVFNANGILLFVAGTVLSQTHVEALEGHRIYDVSVEDMADSITEAAVTTMEKQIEMLVPSQELADNYLDMLNQTKGLFELVTANYTPPLVQFSDSFFPLLTQVMKETGVFHQIYLIEGCDDYTYRHSINVGILSALIAKLIKRPQEEVVRIGQAGLLHDIGKMLIPDDILTKPGSLTAVEFALMKAHTVHGYEMIMKMEGADRMLAECALYHHERLDGSGYPHGKKGSAIPLESQIVAIADVFDAICSDRVYKSKTSPFEAAKVLWKATCRGELNAEIATKFIHYVTSFYIGGRALLNCGDIVDVIMIYPDEPMNPLVRRGGEYLDLRHHRTLWIEKMMA